MLFNNYTKLASTLVAIIYLISKKVIDISNLVDKKLTSIILLGNNIKRESIENFLLIILLL